MPAAFTIKQENYEFFVKEIKRVDKELFNEFRREFRRELQPHAKKVAGNIPSKSPLSGFTKGKGAEVPYLWRKPNPSIDVAARARPKRGVAKIVSVKFKQPAFAILELAGVANKGYDKGGMTQSGLNLVKGLQKGGFGLRDRGRWVIPQWYAQEPAVRAVAIRILEKYMKKVSVKLRERR